MSKLYSVILTAISVLLLALGLAAPAGQFARQRLDAFGAPRTEHDGGSLCGEEPSGRLTQAAAGAGDDDDFSRDIVAHDDAF